MVSIIMYGTLERYWWNTYVHENVQKLFQGRENSKKNKTLFLDDQKKNKKNPVCGWQFKVSLHKTPFFPLKFLLQESDLFWNFLPLNSEINVVFYSYFHIFVDTWFLRNPELNMNLHFWCHNSLYYIGKQNCGQNTSQT